LDVEKKIFAWIIRISYTTSLNTHKTQFWTTKWKIQKSQLNVQFEPNQSLVGQNWIFYRSIHIWCVTYSDKNLEYQICRQNSNFQFLPKLYLEARKGLFTDFIGIVRATS